MRCGFYAPVEFFLLLLPLSVRVSKYSYSFSWILFSVELKPRGYYLELFWQADLGYIGQTIIGVKVQNSSHVASIQH